ncbi:hypothetical protein ACFFMN_02450 [Planobispora siamensis]|nr:hypothetical protein [Planobispora siamensis]
MTGSVAACTVTFTTVDRRASPRPAVLPEPPELDTAAEVWPEATFTLPTRLGNGLDVQPVAMLDTDEVLMITPFALARFVVYDRRTKKHRVLATAPKWGECDLCYDIKSVAVSRTRIAWTAEIYRSEPWNAGKRHMELWTMPRSGGPMRLVTWLTGHGDVRFEDSLVIEGDHAVWDGGHDGYRVPLTGGKADRLPGSFALLDPESRNCGAEWCAQQLPPRPYELTTVAVERKDGSGRTTVAATGGPLIGDRFGLFGPPHVYDDGPVYISGGRTEPSAVVYDRCTGRSAWAGADGADDSSEGVKQGARGTDDPILFWLEPGGRRYAVVDLSRIPDWFCVP